MTVVFCMCSHTKPLTFSNTCISVKFGLTFQAGNHSNRGCWLLFMCKYFDKIIWVPGLFRLFTENQALDSEALASACPVLFNRI